MTTGVVQSVTPEWAGDTLTAATTATTRVLLVGDAGDFEEEFDEPRYLVIGDDFTPRQYVAVANDEDAQQSVTLAADVGAVFEAGLPVVLWDTASASAEKRAIEYRASVLLDDQGKPIPATIPHTMVPTAGAFSLVGASVRIEDTDLGEWYVAEVLGRQSTIHANMGIQGTAADGSPILEVNEAGEATFIGEVGTAPPGEPGVFLYSLKFGRVGNRQTRPVVQLNSGATRDQPSIQADSGAQAQLELFSGANTNHREAKLRLSNGEIYLGIESTADDGLYAGAGMRLNRDNLAIATDTTFTGGNLGKIKFDDIACYIGYDNGAGSLQGFQALRGGGTRVLSSGALAVLSPDATAYRDVNASAFNVSSDSRLKEGVEDPGFEALPLLRRAAVYRWHYADDPDARPRLGVMADDLPLEVAPTAEDGPHEGYRTLDLTQMIAVLTMAVRESDTTVRDQQARIERLEQQVAQLLQTPKR